MTSLPFIITSLIAAELSSRSLSPRSHDRSARPLREYGSCLLPKDNWNSPPHSGETQILFGSSQTERALRSTARTSLGTISPSGSESARGISRFCSRRHLWIAEVRAVIHYVSG